MKIQEMNLELANQLMSWWIETGDCRSDEMKDPDFLYNLLFNDGGKSQFYAIPGVLFILSHIVPGSSGVVFEMGLQSIFDAKEAKKQLIEMVREYDLKRLTFLTPSPITALSPTLKTIGFKYEGRMRHACMYNGKLADVDIFGFYSVKPNKRRRRGRRDKVQDKASSNQTSSASA